MKPWNLTQKPIPPDAMRCDRASVLGNPFDLRNESERDAVVEGFRFYLELVARREWEPVRAAEFFAERMRLQISGKWKRPSRTVFMKALDVLLEKRPEWLLCWCVPKRCHCDVLISFVEWRDRGAG